MPKNALMDRAALPTAAADVCDVLWKQRNVRHATLILDSGEERESVLRAVAGAFDLSDADYARVVAKTHTEKLADALFLWPRSTPEQQLMLLPYISVKTRVEYVALGPSTDAEVFATINALAPQSSSQVALLSALLLRPGIRSSALRDGVPELKLLACWVEQSPADQEVAAEWAMANHALTGAYNPVVGLLNQPSLDRGLRGTLSEFLHWAETEATTLGVRNLGSRGLVQELNFDPVPIAERRQKWDTDLIIKAAGRSTWSAPGGRELAITTPLLYELSQNPHLEYGQRWQVFQKLGIHISLLHGVRSQALFKAFCQSVEFLAGGEEDPVALVERWITGWESPNIKRAARFVFDKEPLLRTVRSRVRSF